MPNTIRPQSHFAAIGVSIALLLSSSSAHAAITLTNGSFESTGATYGSGLLEATGWENLSTLLYQTSSAPAGFETTPVAGVTGLRYLRLASDFGYSGYIRQNMGTIEAGESYRISGDVLNGNTVGVFDILVQLSDGGSGIYAQQLITGLANSQFLLGGVAIGFTPTAADIGNALYLNFIATPRDLGSALRAGVDNLQLQITSDVPEPGSGALLIGGGLALLWWRRRL